MGPRGPPMVPPFGGPPMRGPMPFPYTPVGPPGMMIRPPIVMNPGPRRT